MERIVNIERYNKDIVKEVDEHNKRMDEYYHKKMLEDIEYRAKNCSLTEKKSVYIVWKEGQYEEIFNKY